MSYAATHLRTLAALTLQHLALVAVSLAIALAIAFPAGIVAARNARLGAAIIGTAGVLYTIPSLALLAALVVALGIGPQCAIVALVVYAQLGLVRGIVAGLRGVDPAVVDAARGLGLSPAQRLLRVELPAALPVILAGVRIAAVTLIALATVAGWIAAGGLGTLIFDGLAEHHDGPIVAGALAAALLAIAADAALRACERAVRT
ncbi:MAG TPA: ABC transporter permease [Candidatus Baltobacteraceae bacterium]|nr:ABC transporter permease [Candidatus Baltobacteraceae bacterium]